MQSRKILGVRVDYDLSVPDVLTKIDEFVAEPGPHYLFTLNPIFIMKARQDEALRQVLNSSHLSVADGAGLLFARKYMDWVSKAKHGPFFPLKAFVYGTVMGLAGSLSDTRLAGSEMIYDICEHAESTGQTIFLLGGWEKDKFGRRKPHHGDIADKAAQRLKERFPGLKIIGSSSSFETGENYDAGVISQVRGIMTKAGVDHIDILFVASTTGNQEKWIARNLDKIPAKVGIGVGATFDIIVGGYKKTPESMKKRNLEWIYRLITQPWRIRRIFTSFPIFPLLVYLDSLKNPEQI